MANLAGYDIASYGNMLNHYTRHAGDPDQAKYAYRNGGIDKRRTHLNYAIYEKSADLAAEVRRAIDLADVKPRTGAKATNVLSDLIVTLPRNERLEGREREFFEAVYRFIVENYVHERYVLGAWVHMDETQPHMHFAFVPLVNSVAMTNDKSQPLLDKDGKPKLDGKGTPRYKRVPKLDESGKPAMHYAFGQSKMFDRGKLQKLHPSMEKALEQHFGFKVGIELEDKGEKVLSSLNQPDYIAAKETLERRNREIAATEQHLVEIRGKLGALQEEEERLNGRLECLRQRAAPLERECRELENEEQDLKAENQRLAANSGTAERDQRFESERRELRGRCDVLEEVLGGLVAKIKELLGEIPIPERLVEILEEFGLRSSSRDYAEVGLGLDAKAHEAAEASWAMQHEVGNRKNSQGWESPDGR